MGIKLAGRLVASRFIHMCDNSKISPFWRSVFREILAERIFGHCVIENGTVDIACLPTCVFLQSCLRVCAAAGTRDEQVCARVRRNVCLCNTPSSCVCTLCDACTHAGQLHVVCMCACMCVCVCVNICAHVVYNTVCRAGTLKHGSITTSTGHTTRSLRGY